MLRVSRALRGSDETFFALESLLYFDVVMVEGGGGDEAEAREGLIVIEDSAQFSALGNPEVSLKFYDRTSRT